VEERDNPDDVVGRAKYNDIRKMPQPGTLGIARSSWKSLRSCGDPRLQFAHFRSHTGDDRRRVLRIPVQGFDEFRLRRERKDDPPHLQITAVKLRFDLFPS
jgi:hypothetical protein